MALKTTSHAYTGDKPWSGLAVEVKKGATVQQMMKAAKVDWTIEKRPLAFVDGDLTHHFDNHFALVRNTDKKVMDVCGNRYIPCQNKSFFDFADDVVKKGHASWDSMGSLSDGRIVFGLAKLEAGFKLPGNDHVGGYLFLGVPHIQGRSVIARVTFKRDVCNNTITVALRLGQNGVGNVFRMNHRNEFNTVQREKAEQVIGLAKEQVKEFGDQAKHLHKTRMDEGEATAVIAKTFQPDWDGAKDKLSPKMKAIMDAYTNAPGAQPGTAWGALNAVTYFTDHVASRSEDKRITNAWLGRTSRQKGQVLTRLLAA